MLILTETSNQQTQSINIVNTSYRLSNNLADNINNFVKQDNIN